MTLGFSGDVVDFYQRYRRGYPAETIASIVETLRLTQDDVVVDLGCGTGMLTTPFAGRVRAVVGVDPEPDMLARAREESTATNVTWMVGADTDMPSIHRLLGPIGAVTIGRALHWMDHEALFQTLRPMTRGIAVVTHGTPMWLQETPWSRALREFLEEWMATKLVFTCGTDDASQQGYREALRRAGFETADAEVTYIDELDLDGVVGSVYSVLPEDRLPAPDDRPAFAEQLGRAIEPHGPFVESVKVTTLFGM
jgi:trans-aconitate methyltransferase